jgi:hypothetical protein
VSNRQPPRRSRRSARRRWPFLAIASGVIAAVVIGLVAWFVIAGLDDDDSEAPAGESTGGTAGGPEVMVEGPASRYVIGVQDFENSPLEPFPPETYSLTALSFAANGYWASPQEGEQEAKGWGYLDGYQATLEPAGKLADVVRGGYYVRTEAYLFDSLDGARQAYAHLQQQHTDQSDSEREDARPLGNQSSAFSVVSGTVGTSDVPGVYHRFLFRRGNLVAIVQTYGGEPNMTIDRARDFAVAVDDKALGRRAAPTPTPAAGGTPVVVPPSPTSEP